MDYTSLPLQIVVVILPGIIAAQLVKSLTIGEKWDSFKFGTYAVLYSGLSYLALTTVYWIIWKIQDLQQINQTIFNGLDIAGALDGTISVNYYEVLHAAFVSFVIGLIAAKVINHKLILKAARKLKVTTKFGEENLYYEFLRDPELNDVYVKDVNQNCVYHGIVHSYSESDNVRELVLYDVDVYGFEDNKPFYSTNYLYLSNSISERWWIETPINKHHITNEQPQDNQTDSIRKEASFAASEEE